MTPREHLELHPAEPEPSERPRPRSGCAIVVLAAILGGLVVVWLVGLVWRAVG